MKRTRPAPLGPAAAALAALLLAVLLAGCPAGKPAGRDGRAQGQAADLPPGAPEPDEASQPFRVAEHGPTGTVPHENLEGGAWVLFNRAVVPLAAMGKPTASSAVLSLSPRVEGTFRWYGSRLLSFEPHGALAPATEYTLAVNGATKSLQGEALTGETSFTFRTEPLAIVAMSPTGDDVPPEACREIVLTFNFPVDLRTITPSLRVEAGGRAVAFRASRPVLADRGQLGTFENDERLVSLKPSAALPRDTDVTVRLLAGARPMPATYGTEADATAVFHTLRPLALDWIDVYVGRPAPAAVVRFNHPIEKAGAAAALRTSIAGYDTVKNADVWGRSVYLENLPVPFESSFTLQVGAGIRDIYGQALGGAEEREVEVGPAESYVDFRQTGSRLLESRFPPLAAIEFQNVDAGSWTGGALAHPFDAKLPEPSTPIDVAAVARNVRHFETFDLAPWLNGQGTGAAFLSWRFTGKFWGSDEPQEVSDSLVVQVTDIGANLHVASDRVLVQLASLSSGAPIEGASVALRRGGSEVASARSDAKGLASIPLAPGMLSRAFPTQEAAEEAEILVAKGSDRLVLRPARMDFGEWNHMGPYSADTPRPLTYMWTDRGIYRPGETVSFAGIDRDLAMGRLSTVAGGFRAELLASGGAEKPLAAIDGRTSRAGGFEGSFALPKDLEPGEYSIVFRRGGQRGTVTGSVWLRVALFRRVTYAVDVSIPEGRKLMGGTIEARVAGKYLAGGNVSKGKWSWFWTRRETWYQPPGEALAGYSFGDVQKGWAEDLGSDEGSLGGDGTVVAAQKLADGEKGRVYFYELVATIEDIDRQAISRSAGGLVFSSECQLGARITAGPRSDETLYFVKKGTPFSLGIVSVDPEGRPLAPRGPITGRLVREEWKLVRERTIGGVVDTRYEREQVVEKSFTAKAPSGSAPSVVQLSTGSAGSYAVELEARDAKGRQSFTRLSFYSTGSGEAVWNRSDERRIEIVPDRQVYKPGDTAHLLVKSPVAKGSFLVLVERDGILEQRTVELAGAAPTIDVTVREEHVPVVYVSVSTTVPRTAPPAGGPDLPDFGKPRGWSGLAELRVDTGSRAIQVEVHPSKASYLPGSSASVTVSAAWNGKPLEGAEVALVAADRGVLDLVDYHVPDPLEHFYARWLYPDRVAHYDSRELLLDPVTWKVRDLPGGDEKGEAAAEPGAQADYALRSDFRPTAVFRTGLVTGSDGTVTVEFTLPDLLTRFRTTAVGAKNDLFGKAEAEIVVQNPVNVRAALPRRLRAGDSASAGVVLTNLDSDPHEIAIAAASASAAVAVGGPAEKTVRVKAGESLEVPFVLEAKSEGEAALTFTVTSDVLKERLQEKLAVESAFVREAFTIVGSTTGPAGEGLAVPARFAGTADEGLYLTLDSTIASALAGAVHYLEAYPFDCLEQRTSKLFAAVLFPELARAGRGKVAADMDALARYANPDGGFSYWDGPAPRRSSYYATLRVAHLLAAAAERGVQVPRGIDVPAMLGYIAAGYDSPWNEDLRGYALYVLAVHGRKERQKADALAARGDAIGVLGLGFLGLARDAMGDRRAAETALGRLKNFVRVGTRSVTLVGTVNDAVFYGGDVQAKALLLMLYARVAPTSQLVQGLAGDLLESDRTGYWQNTSNAGWVLQAFAEIVERKGEKEADFTARVTLGTEELARRQFRGFSRQPAEVHVAAADLSAIAARQPGGAAGAPLPLTFDRQGRGTLYYTGMLRWSIPAAEVGPRDEGIGVAAEITDEQGRAVEGTALELGKVYRVRLVLYSSRDRTFLAVRAPIPSGAEPIDGSLVTSQVVRPPAKAVGSRDAGEGEEDGGGWWDGWYTTKVYDNEVRFFFDVFGRGKQEVSFLFRTTTPGSFPTPPVQAELMYQGEVFGRTSGAVYTIAEKPTRK